MIDEPVPLNFDEGPCAMCRARPAEILGLVCGRCRDAIDAAEPWTLAHAEVIERLHLAEAEEEAAASPSGLD